MRRPLCYFAVVLMGVIYIYYFIFQVPSLDSPRDGTMDSFQGIVYSKELQKDKLIVYLKNVHSLENPNKTYENIILYLSDKEEPKLRSVVQVEGRVKCFEEANNQGEFNAKEYYDLQKINFALYDVRIIRESVQYSKYRELLWRIKKKASKVYDSYLTETDSASLKAIVLGSKKQMDINQKKLYRMSGISHVMAISGMHITVLGLGLYKLLKKIKLPNVMCITVPIIVIVLYGEMVGVSSSAFRAIMMFSLKIIADYLGRRFDTLSALALSAITILIEQPLYIYQAGFLLSFLAIIGVCFFPKILNPQKIYYEPLIINISIFISQLPIMLFYFYEFPLISFLINLVVIPFIPGLFMMGILLLPYSMIKVSFGILPEIIHILIFLMEKLCGLGINIPGMMWVAGRPKKVCIVLYYCLLTLALILKKKKKIENKKVIYIILIALVLLNAKKQPGLEVNYLCVGQGNASVITDFWGHNFIIDGGSVSKANVGEYILLPFLRYKGIGKIDGVFITHLDSDHENGIEEILNNSKEIRIKKVYISEAVIKDNKYYEIAALCKKERIPIQTLRYGDQIQKGQIKFKIYHPTSDFHAEDNNDTSLVIGLEYKSFKALFSGDISGEIENRLITRLDNEENYEVFLATHHGSKYSNEEAFLEKIKPDVTIISCGRNNSYGHPHKEAVERISKTGSNIYLTYEKGNITIRTNGKKHSISTFH